MANIRSQIKRNRQNEKRRVRNKAVRSEMRTRAKVAISDADAELALKGAQAWPDDLVMEVLVARLARASRGGRRR